MTNHYMDPIHLPIVPPMDLNGTPSNISAFPLQLRAYGGTFNTPRGAHDFIEGHAGVDLLAPLGTPVFAVSTGYVTDFTDHSVVIFHDRGFKFLTYYQHLQNVSVAVGPVESGLKLGEVGVFDPTHLHFELRYPYEPVVIPTRLNTLPVDPTDALYQWEARAYRHTSAERDGQFYDNVNIELLEEVIRGRAGRFRFLLVKVSQQNARELYVPFIDSSPGNLSLIETLKLAFFHSKRVRIFWRESLFFSLIQDQADRAAIIAEVSVLS